MGGRAWFRPQGQQADLRNKAIWDRNKSKVFLGLSIEDSCTALIVVAGSSFGGAPEGMKAVVSKMELVTLKGLAQAPRDRALREHEWAAIDKLATQERSGQIRRRFSSTDELSIAHGQLHGTPVWTGSSWRRITINNPQLATWKPSKLGGAPGRVSGQPGRG